MTKKKRLSKPIKFNPPPQPGPAPFLPGFKNPDLSKTRLVDVPEPPPDEEGDGSPGD